MRRKIDSRYRSIELIYIYLAIAWNYGSICVPEMLIVDGMIGKWGKL